ncbi:MAG TPA: sulfotransferase [Phycisphaerales bacterium]|nr:sulfotransferase [Phycisphaerales bacterium]
MTTFPTSNPSSEQAPDARRGLRTFMVRGHMKSGTNWVCALLNLHPEICCVGEFHFERLRQAFDDFADRPWMVEGFEAARQLGREAVDRFAVRCLEMAAESKPGAKLVGDRTPAPLGDEIPDSPIIHITRDGRDVLVSWAYHTLRLGRPAAHPEIERWRLERLDKLETMPDTPEQLLDDETIVRMRARRWSKVVLGDLEWIRNSSKGESSNPVLAINYETLHNNVDAARREMYRFLGVDPGKAAPVSTESLTTAGFGDRAEDPTNFYRAGKVGQWKRYFSDQTKKWFQEEAGQALIAAGYEHDLNW